MKRRKNKPKHQKDAVSVRTGAGAASLSEVGLSKGSQGWRCLWSPRTRASTVRRWAWLGHRRCLFPSESGRLGTCLSLWSLSPSHLPIAVIILIVTIISNITDYYFFFIFLRQNSHISCMNMKCITCNIDEYFAHVHTPPD